MIKPINFIRVFPTIDQAFPKFENPILKKSKNPTSSFLENFIICPINPNDIGTTIINDTMPPITGTIPDKNEIATVINS